MLDKPPIRRRFRPTIMDGRVVEFATEFRASRGVFGASFEALGPFEISASRNAIVVHRAYLDSDEDIDAFREALTDARRIHEYISRHDDVPQEIRSEHEIAEKEFAAEEVGDAKP